LALIAIGRRSVDRQALTHAGERLQATRQLVQHVVQSIEAAEQHDTPFHHLRFDHFFPDGTYAAILDAMPAAAAYRRMSGRSKGNDLADGTPTRVKVDLFSEYIRHLPSPQRAVWDMVGQAVRSPELQAAFVRRLAPGLQRRFGSACAEVGMYPVPILTHDVPGYRIAPHTDTHWKGITVQIYLPPDTSAAHVGTVFLERSPDGKLTKTAQMSFAPNSGYAFAVGHDTWHSLDPVGPEVQGRDSILLTYFVDSGAFRVLRNRTRRFANFVLNELKRGQRS
jgi:hypothetical protein